MPIVATKDPVFSEFLVDNLDPTIQNFGIAQVNVNLAAEATLNWGDVLFPSSGTLWRQLVNADVANIGTTVDSSLPNNAPVCIVVGSASGLGRDYSNTIAATTDTAVTVLYRGPASFKGDKLAYGDTVSDANQLLVQEQIETQNVQLVDVATTLNSQFHV